MESVQALPVFAAISSGGEAGFSGVALAYFVIGYGFAALLKHDGVSNKRSFIGAIVIVFILSVFLIIDIGAWILTLFLGAVGAGLGLLELHKKVFKIK